MQQDVDYSKLTTIGYTGRIGRAAFIFSLVYFFLILGGVLSVLTFSMLPSFGYVLARVISFLMLLYILAIYSSAVVRRCHDVGVKDYLVVFFIFIPILMLPVMFIKGQTLENHHGKKPRYPHCIYAFTCLSPIFVIGFIGGFPFILEALTNLTPELLLSSLITD